MRWAAAGAVTGAGAATPPIAWKKAARADAAVLEGAAPGAGGGRFGRMVVIGRAFVTQG